MPRKGQALSLSEFHEAIGPTTTADPAEVLPDGPSGAASDAPTRKWISEWDGRAELLPVEIPAPAAPTPLKTEPEFKEALDLCLSEFFSSGDLAEATRCVVELHSPEFHLHIVKRGVRIAMDKADREREMIAAYVVGVAQCDYAYAAHCAAAYAWGIADGLIDQLLADLETAPVEDRFRPLLAYVQKLTLSPSTMTQEDADAVFDAGWDEKALHDAIAVCARMNFMCRLVEGHGFLPMDANRARENAENRKRLGYKNLYPTFVEEDGDGG